MNLNQEMLIKLLSVAINTSDISLINDTNIDWEYLYTEAKTHQVHTLLYPVMKKINTNSICTNDLIEMWRKETMFSSVNQVHHMKQIRQVLSKFYNSGIKTVILKGLVLRNLYPNHELRTMSDADLLIHKEDLNAARKILIDLGYYESASNPKHIIFSHEIHLEIELHWLLINDTYSKDAAYFENTVWDNIIPMYFYDIPVLSLSNEYLLFFLFLHLLDHTLCSGFGLRQLCDIIVLINSSDHSIDWDKFNRVVKECKLQNFVGIILHICTKLFNLNLPATIDSKKISDVEFVNLFIDVIVSGGTFGKRNTSDTYSDILLNYLSNSTYSNLNYMLSYYLQILFPSPRSLGERYHYTQRHRILLPFAWIHRFFYNIIGKKHSISENTNLLSKTVKESIQRDKFLKQIQQKFKYYY